MYDCKIKCLMLVSIVACALGGVYLLGEQNGNMVKTKNFKYLGAWNRQRLKSKKSSCLECLSQTTKDTVVNTLEKDTNQTVYCYRRISSTIWCGNVDNNKNYEKAT